MLKSLCDNSTLVWGLGYIVAQCTYTPNFIFAIKQGGLDKTFDV